jgi:hypothetical protein
MSSQPSPFGFHIQFIGKNRYVTQIEQKKRNFCNTIPCLRDADILFTRASQYEVSDPCSDFANFTLGSAQEIGSPNDRYPVRGFLMNIYNQYWHRLRNVLMRKGDRKSEKIVKIVKNFFRNCIQSPHHALRHVNGHLELVEFLQSLGGSPYLSKHVAWNEFLFDHENDFGLLHVKNFTALSMNLWDESEFSVVKIMESDAEHFMQFLLNVKLSRCGGDEILCIKRYSLDDVSDYFNENLQKLYEDEENYLKILEIMNDKFISGTNGKEELSEKLFKPALVNFKKYLKRKIKIEKKYRNSKPETMTIQELNLRMRHFKIDWVNVTNLQLFNYSRATETDLILVHNFELLYKLMENLQNMPKR